MDRIPKVLLTTALVLAVLAPNTAAAEENEKSPFLAATLNFFVPGAGYLYNGEKPLYVTLPMIAATGGFVYLEQVHEYGDSGQKLLDYDQDAFIILFSTIFVMNTALAIDAWQEADMINERARGESASLQLGVQYLPPAATGDKSGVGLRLSTRW